MLDVDDPAAIKIVKSILDGSCGTLSDNTLKSISIDTLYSVAQLQQDRNLVTRSRNILKTNGVNDLYALSIQTYQTMKNMRNAGNKVIAEIKDIITALGREMKLRNENPIDDPMNTPFYCKERADFMRKHGLYTYRDFINAVGTGKVSLDKQHESVISFKNACFERFSSIIGKKGD